MIIGRRRVGMAFTVLGVLSALVGCSTTTGGSGALQSGIVLPTPSSAPGPSGASSAPSSSAPSSSASTQTTPTAPATPIDQQTITGTGTAGGSYDMSLWAKDTVTDCAAHSHGQPIINYFKAHPCRSAVRRLWTFDADGRTIALSIVTVECEIKKVNNNPDFSAATQLVTLENADGTGSINDLLREGKRIPEAAASIPTNEVFFVNGEDATVVVMDGWYTFGTTDPKDPRLTSIMRDLALSDASAVN